MLALLNREQEIKSVSVPLRGKYRGEFITYLAELFILLMVSVPLRGKYRGEFQQI
jgi:hypothetical protein